MIVHLLKHGNAICGFRYPVPPRDWPKDHKWVGAEESKEVTCKSCRRLIDG